MTNILDHFNPALTPWDWQRDTLLCIEQSFNAAIRAFLGDCPTGTGKSDIGMAVARWKGSATICTVQNVLLDAYTALGAFPIMGKRNYDCSFFQLLSKDQGGCQAASRIWDNGSVKPSKEDWEIIEAIRGSSTANAETHASCIRLAEKGLPVHSLLCRDYCEQYRRAKNSPIVVTNYDFQIVSPFKRELLILDEAHHASDKLLDHVSITITKKDALECGAVSPGWKAKQPIPIQEALAWASSYAIAARDYKVLAQQTLKDMDLKKRDKLLVFLDRISEQIEKIATLDEHFFASTTEPGDRGGLQFRPLRPQRYASRLTDSAEYLLIMSGTLDTDRVQRELALPKATTKAEHLVSPFPKENRPIHCPYVCNMSQTGIPRSQVERVQYERIVYKMVPEVQELLFGKHREHKGIIFAGSYKYTKYVVDALSTTMFANRILTHAPDIDSRKDVLKQHIESPEPTVIVTPSLTEGIDLKDGLGRFCVILKVPYGDFGDPYVRARKNIDPEWYEGGTATTITQMVGRIVRHQNDWGISYVFDEGFERLRTQYAHLFRNWWLEAVQ
jgi:ATP-dependent DNA helicase DinG